MFPFFETIRYSNAIAANLFFHQQRVERTFLRNGVDPAFDLMAIDFKREAEKHGALNEAVYKCKILYDLKSNYTISFEAYQIRSIKTFSLVDIGNNDYSIKFTDRTWINMALQSVSTDDVIFTKDEILKDASYANIVLFDGNDWVTPAKPLLLGTKRALLLSEKKIIEKEIRVEQLKDFKSLKFINAMMLWDESPTIDLG
jgi:4-amino-4-deoxychorismate lyase